ncbi:MAG: HAD-IA family hydrolase [Clostridiales Family XIII bacterium]|jgi:pyrophosphatase PpaX|nr:HAD-IA family hydrolase [Clostridiales Family XIII bacterium]
MTINTVLFDFDGTLMDTNQLIIDSWQHVFLVLEGRERPVEDIIKTLGEPLVDTLSVHFPELSFEEAARVYRSYHVDSFESRIRLFPGMSALLKQLKKDAYKIGLVTSRLKKTTWQGLDKFDLGRYFDVVVTCEDTSKNKPDPAPVFLALEKLKSSAKETIMIGDTISDIHCARSAGVLPVLAGWSISVSEEDRCGADAPEYIAADAADLARIISSGVGR